MRNATAVIFLCLAIVVAFFHILLNDYQYTIFCLPFFLACVLKDKIAKIIETMTLAVIGMYILVWQSEYTGMVVLYASVIWFFVYIHRDLRAKIYIGALSIFITAATYFTYKGNTENLMIHALLDAAFFGMGSAAMLLTINNLEANIKTESKPISDKYITLLDTLSRMLHDVIDTIKKMQEGEGNDRPRKDC